MALISGGVLGVLYFLVLHPWLTGLSEGFLILGRDSAIALFFRGILIILILAVVITAATFPDSPEQTFKIAFIIAVTSLFPIPFTQYFVKAPRLYGDPLISFSILGNAAMAACYFSFAAFIVAGITCILIWLVIKPLLKKLSFRHRA
jgi:hypothetical protein